MAPPLATAITEYLAWLEIDRHRSPRTVSQYADALPHETLPQLRDRALIIFLLSTGCRISEALNLDRSDWQREQVVVMGKRRKERVVIISPKARAAVDEYLAARSDPSPALFI